MLNEVFIKYITNQAMTKYAFNNKGKLGIRKADVIEAVMNCGGDMDDVRAAMEEGMIRIAPEKILKHIGFD